MNYFYHDDMDKEKPKFAVERVFLNYCWGTLGVNLAD
jgi:hypothetical protein